MPAAGHSGRIVRVAFPIQSGLTEYDSNGKRTGYIYEYLQEIAQYTGWDYEFVEAPGEINESLTTLMDMLSNGEIDLLGGILYNDASSQLYDYSGHSCGAVETVLQVPMDVGTDVAINSQVSQVFRIAAISTSKRLKSELEDYCEMNLVTPEYVDCDNMDEQIAAIREGRADMLLNTSMNYVEGLKTVARFASKPFYFVTTKGRDPAMMEELNSAMLSIQQASPYFEATLFNKYFSPTDNVFRLSESEREYVASAGVLKVGVLSDQPPYQYVSGKNREITGIAVELLDYLSEKTGLAFEWVQADTPEELYGLVADGQVQLVAGMPYSYDLAQERGLSMSRPYVSSQYVLLMGEKGSEVDIKEKRMALTTSGSYDGTASDQITRYDTTAECIRAVSRGDADYTYVDAYTAQYYLNLPEYRNLKMVPQTYSPRQMCFGMVKPGSHRLLSVLNKAIASMSETDVQSIINRNTINRQPFSLSYFVRENPFESIVIVMLFSLVIIGVLLFFLWQRAKMSKANALELKKHYRVYAMMNEYFYEYSFKDNAAVVSIPSQDGKGQPELAHYDYNSITDDSDEARQRQQFLSFIRSQEDGVREMHIPDPKGNYHWLRVALETVYDGDAPAYAIGKINVVDEEKKEMDELLEQSQLDSLTQIYNAKTCRQLVSDCMANLEGEAHGALLLLDIDLFKTINDTYGHLQGDKSLRQMAGLLKGGFREEDIVGRPGGDEFLVYIKDMKDTQTLCDVCARLCANARTLEMEPGKGITISLGAVLTSAGSVYEQIYRAADKALYEAKKQGRDRFCIAP